MTIEVRPVQANELRRALRMTLALNGQSAARAESQVTQFIQYAREMRLDAGRSWWCLMDGHEVGACTCLELPGRTATLMLPCEERCAVNKQALRVLLQHVVAEEAARDMRVALSLLQTDDGNIAATMSKEQFDEIAELLYLEWIAPPAGWTPAATVESAVHEWATYSPRTHATFRDLVAQTYSGSLDCPRLNGLRPIEDIIAGHQAAGRFQEHRWLMLRHYDRPAGCILMAEHPLQPVLEVAYLGVHPELRGLGLGRALIERGLELAHREGFTRVTLAVDSCNTPALRLYRAMGFRPTTRRRALARALTASSGITGT
jgi:ribosomal protein S18 acetylase RimI-like enzyme